MTAGSSIDMSGWLHEHLDQASPDLLREMVRSFAQALMSAEADVVCGAGSEIRHARHGPPAPGERPADGSSDDRCWPAQGLAHGSGDWRR
jgi:putative transposase